MEFLRGSQSPPTNSQQQTTPLLPPHPLPPPAARPGATGHHRDPSALTAGCKNWGQLVASTPDGVRVQACMWWGQRRTLCSRRGQRPGAKPEIVAVWGSPTWKSYLNTTLPPPAPHTPHFLGPSIRSKAAIFESFRSDLSWIILTPSPIILPGRETSKLPPPGGVGRLHSPAPCADSCSWTWQNPGFRESAPGSCAAASGGPRVLPGKVWPPGAPRRVGRAGHGHLLPRAKRSRARSPASLPRARAA